MQAMQLISRLKAPQIKTFEYFHGLPVETREKILFYLSLYELINFSMTCKLNYELSKSKFLWVNLYGIFGIISLDHDFPREHLIELLKRAKKIESLHFFKKKKGGDLKEWYSHTNSGGSEEFWFTLNVTASDLQTQIYHPSKFSIQKKKKAQKHLETLLLLRNIGANIPKSFNYNEQDRYTLDQQFISKIIHSPHFAKYIQALHPFYKRIGIHLFFAAFKKLDFDSCLLLKTSIGTDLIILNEKLILGLDSLILALKLKKEGFNILPGINVWTQWKIFVSYEFAEAWVSFYTPENLPIREFPANYFNDDEDYKIAKLLIQKGFYLSESYLKDRLFHKPGFNISLLIDLYEEPVLIPVPDYIDEKMAHTNLKMVTQVILKTTKQLKVNFCISDTMHRLSEIKKKIGLLFLNKGMEVASNCFEEAVRLEKVDLLKDLIALYPCPSFIDINFPPNYFSKPIHFEIAALFVDEGYHLPRSYLNLAVFRQEEEKIIQLVHLYLNQAPFNVSIPPHISSSQAEKFMEILRQISGSGSPTRMKSGIEKV